MDDKLVHDCNLVLSTIFKDNLWVNKVIEKTGLARNRGLEVIRFLEKSEIIIKTKDEKHKQKEIMSLTEFGRDLAMFNENLNMFEESHERLITKINLNFNDCDKTFLKKKFGIALFPCLNQDDLYKQKYDNINNQKADFLERKGWSSSEIPNFDKWRVASIIIKTDFIDVAIELIIFKHRLYLLKYRLNPKAKELLLKLVETKTISYFRKKMLLLEEGYKIDDIEDENLNTEEAIMTIFDESGNYLIEKTEQCITHNFGNRFIIPHINDLILRSMSIVGMDKEHLKSRLNDEENLLKQLISEKYDEYKEERQKVIDFFYKSLSSP